MSRVDRVDPDRLDLKVLRDLPEEMDELAKLVLMDLADHLALQAHLDKTL